MSTRRACDRCYKYKEKCHFEDNADKCGLCTRSKSTCTTLRSQPRQGRRPKVKRLGPNSSIQVWEVSSPCKITKKGTPPTQRHAPMSPAISDPDTSESSSIGHTPASNPSMYLFDDPETLREFSPYHVQQFYLTYDIFMLGPTFAAAHRAAFSRSYIGSPVLLRDIFIAIYTAIARVRNTIDLPDQPDVVHGAVSLEKLRNAKVSRLEDALAIMALGQTLAAFDLITNCVGSSLIIRYSLFSAQPWYSELSQDPSLDAVTITPILWDTVCCLVRREIPIIKFQPSDSNAADRLAGLCKTLLPILYDLCVANYHLNRHEASYSSTEAFPVKEIEERLLAWTPEIPSDFETAFSEQEILTMKTQALMYQKAALLIAHRAIHPIGTQDGVARLYASSITLEAVKHSLMTSWDEKAHNIGTIFPIFMAALEIPDLSKELWENIGLLLVAKWCSIKMKAFVEYFWKERRNGYQGFVLDLIEKGPDFVVIV